MNRSIKVERIYSLGSYQNLTVSDELTNIPEAYASNEVLMARLYELLLLGLEIKINRYYVLRDATKNLTPENAIAYLEDQRDNLLKEIIENKDKENAEVPTVAE